MKRKLCISVLMLLVFLTGCQQGKTDIPLPTNTPTEENSVVMPEPTSTSAPEPTSTPTPEPTSTPTPKPTNTPTPEPTSTPTPEPTSTPTPKPTNTPTPEPTSTPTPEPTSTPTPEPTNTPTPEPTSTPTPEPTSTPTPEPTSTPTPEPTSTPTPKPTNTPTPKPKPEYYTSDNWKEASIGDKIRFGSFEQDNNLSNGAEVIEWIVAEVEEDSLRLFSANALTALPYAEEYTYNGTWRDSIIREWLNGYFYENSFTETEKEHIILVQKEHWYFGNGTDRLHGMFPLDQGVQDDTLDYAFLPGYELWQYDCSSSTYAMAQEHETSTSIYGTDCLGYWIEGGTDRYEYTIMESIGSGENMPVAQNNPTLRFMLLPSIWVAKEGKAGTKYFYTDEDIFATKEVKGGVEITGVTDTTYTEIYVPAVIDGKKVVGIADKAFSDCKKLTRIKLPENVTRIASNAFKGCDNLVEIFLPSTLEKLDTELYKATGSLKYIDYAENMNASVLESIKEIKLAISRTNNAEIWEVIDTDTGRYGMWDLTYKEFIEMYLSIGTEQDLFVEMLKKKGPAHTGDKLYYDYDGIANLEITFESITAEKIYALHYAPFEYNHEDLEKGAEYYNKSRVEAYQDHGGVCSILAQTYRHFLKQILGETDWRYANYSNRQVNHEALLIKTEDGKVFQIDNAEGDYWWLGIEFRPDYSKMNHPEAVSSEVEAAFLKWKSEYTSAEKIYWHTFRFFCNYDHAANEWKIRRQIWYNFETGEPETYLGADVPTAYVVSYRGLPDKVISMAGYPNLDGYKDLVNVMFNK